MNRCFPVPAFLSGLLISLLPAPSLTAQNRDLQAERIIIDDNGDDGTMNTLTIESPSSLSQNVVLTIPEPSGSSASFLLYDSADGSALVWLLGGNSGTVAGDDFLGTSDGVALSVQVRNTSGSVLSSLVLNENGSLQRDTGGDERGEAAIDLQMSRSADTQSASGQYSVIGGGSNHTASGSFATVSGGVSNTASAYNATVGGGEDNIASGWYATAGGGTVNTASGFTATVSGGSENTAAGDYSAIPGGNGLKLDSLADRSFGFLANSVSNKMTISEPDVAVFGNTDLWLANNDGTAGQLRLYESNNNTGNFPETGTSTVYYTSLEAGELEENIVYILPTTVPTAGQVLQAGSISTSGSVTTVTLQWEDDATATAAGDETPTQSIAEPESGMDERIRMMMEMIEMQREEIRQLKLGQKKMLKMLEQSNASIGTSQDLPDNTVRVAE